MTGVPLTALVTSTTVAGGLVHAPVQLRRMTLGTVAWVQNDTDAALIGLGSAILLYLGFIGIRYGIVRLIGRDRDVTTWQGFIGRMVRRTRSFFLATLAVDIAARTAAPPGALLVFLKMIFTVAAAIQGAVWVREFILGLVDRRAAVAEDKAELASAANIIRVLVNVVVWSLAFILVLDNLGVNITALVAGLGVGGIAIGLAAQGIFADLFAALAILFDRPFRVGDTIRWGTVTGKVEAIGLKTVRIRSQSGEQVIVGNTKLLSDQISNLHRIAERQVVMVFGVTYQTASDLLDAIPAEIAAIVAATPGARFDRAHFVRFAASSLDFELVFFSNGQSFMAMMDARHAIGLAILRRFNALGIDFAYPTQVAMMAGADGRVIDPPVTAASPPQGATG
jgi:small-conductance mechanosensitive channel